MAGEWSPLSGDEDQRLDSKISVARQPRHKRLDLLRSTTLLVVAALLAVVLSAQPTSAAGPRPSFQLPFSCGSKWRPTTYDSGANLSTGATWSHLNYLDFGQAGAAGKPVLASESGRARLVDASEGKVEVDHGSGWKTVYQHMNSVTVTSSGKNVARGEKLGAVASVGANSTGDHLHYAQLKDGAAVNPVFNGSSYAWGQGTTYADGSLRLYNDRTATGSLTSQNCATPPPPPPQKWPPSNGDFVEATDNGEVYRVVGGAPVYLGDWAAVGGEQPTISAARTQLNTLRQLPADGTFVSAGGLVYRFAGGAPTYVGDWAAVGGQQAATVIDPAAIDNADGSGRWSHVRRYPADGTFVSAGGLVYRFAGGAPTYVGDWAAVGGPKAATVIDPAAIDNADGSGRWSHVRRYPADGTFVSAGGLVYRFVGGAPTYVGDWAAVGGPKPATVIDPAAIDNADGSGRWSHVRRYPADGTFVSAGGLVYRFAGGAPTFEWVGCLRWPADLYGD